jgi:uncharacterized DUF497 family protein
MSNTLFDWDPDKAKINLREHKISFEEAKTVFWDEDALMIYDTEHSEKEERFLLLGMSTFAKLLIVCHCYREKDDIVRIISARKADKVERSQYFRRKEL